MRKQSDAVKVSSKVQGPTQNPAGSDAGQKAMAGSSVKRDFFGRVIHESMAQNDSDAAAINPSDEKSKAGRQVWVTFHEGFSNAVRKPISLGEMLAGL